MKTVTITCHDVYNYGASLQAYALQRMLMSCGIENQIIDYKPDYLSRKYQFTHVNKKSKLYSVVKHLGPLKIILGLYSNRKYLKFWKRKRCFDDFKNVYLQLTPRRYSDYFELNSDCPVADWYITGSDQVWNTDLKNGHDKSFFLLFAPEGHRISYAASFGISSLPTELHDKMRDRLGSLSWISVRESTGVKIVESLGLNAVQVMDPVFLLTKNDWQKLTKPVKMSRKYLLLYYLGKINPLVEILTKKIAEELGLTIVSINDSRIIPFADVNVNGAGPLEFLSYLASAEYVVSTSFHATSFSVIFNKQFCVCPISGQRNQSRMKDLLSMLNLNDRFVTEIDKIPAQKINYEHVNEIVSRKSGESREMLLNQLS